MSISKIDFQAPDESQGFRPLKAPGVSDQLRQNFERQESAIARYEKGAAAVRKMTLDLKNNREEKEAQDRLNRLSAFSETLKKGLDMGLQFAQAKRQEALASIASDIMEKDNSSWYEEINQAYKTGKKVDEQVIKGLQSGVPYEAVHELKRLNPFDREIVKGYMFKAAADNFKAGIYSGFDTDDQTQIRLGDEVFTPMQVGTDPAKAAAAFDVLKDKWLSESQLAHIATPEEISRYFAPASIKLKNELLQRKRKQHRQTLSSENRVDAERGFHTHLDVGLLVTKRMQEIDSNDKPIGRAEAWKQVEDHVVALASNGALSNTEIEAIFNKPDPGAPQQLLREKQNGYFYNRVRNARDAYDKKQLGIINDRKEAQAKEADLRLQSVIDQKYANGEQMSDAEEEQWAKEFFSKYGRESSTLKNWRKNYISSDEAAQSRYEQELERKRLNFTLTKSDLLKKGVSKKLYDTYIGYATQQDKERAVPNGVSHKVKDLSGYIDKKFTISLYKTRSDIPDIHERLVKNFLIQDYNTNRAAGLSEHEAAKLAYSNAKLWHAEQMADPTSRLYEDDNKNYPNIDGIPTTLQDNRDKVKQTMTRINSAVEAANNWGVLPNVLFGSKEEAETVKQQVINNGYVPPYKFTHYAPHAPNQSATELLNLSLKAMGVDPIEFPKALGEFEGTLSPEEKRLVFQTPSPNRRARAYCTSGNGAQWTTPSLPDNLGVHIESAAKRYAAQTDMTPEELSMLTFSVGDWENRGVWRNGRTSSAGAKGYWQFIDSTARQYGVDPLNPASASDGAVRHLVDSYVAIKQQYPQKSKIELMGLAALAYNAGTEGVLNNLDRNPQFGGSYGGGENRTYLAGVLMSMCRFGGASIALDHPALRRMSEYNTAATEDFRSTILRNR